MGLAYNYTDSLYREIEFDSKRLPATQIGLLAKLPEGHKVLRCFTYAQLGETFEPQKANNIRFRSPVGPDIALILDL